MVCLCLVETPIFHFEMSRQDLGFYLLGECERHDSCYMKWLIVIPFPIGTLSYHVTLDGPRPTFSFVFFPGDRPF